MNEKGIIELLSALDVHQTHVGGSGWVQASCPLAFAKHKHGHDSNPSFGINIVDDGRSGYSCFACGAKGRDLSDLLIEMQHYAKLYGNVRIDLAKARQIAEQEDEIGYMPHEWTDTSEAKEFEPWPDWYLDDFKPAWGTGARAYLMKRGISADICNALDIRFDSRKGMVCFPVRHRSGFLSGLRGRSIDGKKYHDYVWNGNNNTSVTLYGEQWLNPLKPVVVVEGPFDLAAVYPHYKNVCALFMASINKRKMAMLQCAVEMVAFTDEDLAGEQVFWHMRDVAPATLRIPIAKGKKDPGEMTPSEIRKALRDFVKLDG